MADPTFANDIKPLFRDKDRSSMRSRFDLWSIDDVRGHAPAIFAMLESGRMPCDGAWSAENVTLFGRWMDSGMPE
jgi:hypothetical protein